MREIAARQARPVDPPLLLLGHQIEVAAAGRLRPLDDPVGDRGDGRVEAIGAIYSCQLMPSRSVSAIAADGPQVPAGIGPRGHALLRPGGADPVDPRPLRLDLVAADEQGRVALDEVEQQPLVGDAPAILAEGIGEADVERDFAQTDALRDRGRASSPSRRG